MCRVPWWDTTCSLTGEGSGKEVKTPRNLQKKTESENRAVGGDETGFKNRAGALEKSSTRGNRNRNVLLLLSSGSERVGGRWTKEVDGVGGMLVIWKEIMVKVAWLGVGRGWVGGVWDPGDGGGRAGSGGGQ